MKDIDYTVAYSNNTAVGTATVTINGMGAYGGTNSANFNILKSISGATVVLDKASEVYTGSPIAVGVTSVTLTDSTVLDEDGYTVSYSANINVGTVTVTVTGKGNYAGTATAIFAITIDDEGIEGLIEDKAKPAFGVGLDSAADLGIGSSVFQKLAGAAKTLTVDVTDDEGKVMYSWVFDGAYDASAAGTFNAGISEMEPGAELLAAIASAGAANPLVLSFAANGILPVNATVKYHVGDKYESGATLTLYFFNEDTGKLEAAGQGLVVDADGFVKFSPPHFSLYVLAESIPGPASGGSANLIMYIAAGVVVLAIIAAAVLLRRK